MSKDFYDSNDISPETGHLYGCSCEACSLIVTLRAERDALAQQLTEAKAEIERLLRYLRPISEDEAYAIVMVAQSRSGKLTKIEEEAYEIVASSQKRRIG